MRMLRLVVVSKENRMVTCNHRIRRSDCALTHRNPAIEGTEEVDETLQSEAKPAPNDGRDGANYRSRKQMVMAAIAVACGGEIRP
jgi:hypothetical protein